MELSDNQIFEAAKASFLFNGIEADELKKIIGAAKIVTKQYHGSEQITSPSSFVKGLYYIISGGAAVKVAKNEGGVLLRVLREGDVFGATSLFSDSDSFTASNIYARGKTKIMVIPKDTAEKMITGNSTIAENYIRFMSGRVRFLNTRISALTAGTAEQKVACFLLEMPVNEDGHIILPKMTQLAMSVNLGRASLYRAMQTLESTGHIRKNDDGTISIVSIEALKNII